MKNISESHRFHPRSFSRFSVHEKSKNLKDEKKNWPFFYSIENQVHPFGSKRWETHQNAERGVEATKATNGESQMCPAGMLSGRGFHLFKKNSHAGAPLCQEEGCPFSEGGGNEKQKLCN